ncbi:rhodanese-like domain-containing protein [Clostridiaceae bacterium HSG29]|nr:rhodanese-like domain-containing protein [Clostridiaceae bacterium HSG29]
MIFKGKRISIVFLLILSTLVFAACSTNTSYDESMNFVEASEVKEVYLNMEDNIQVIDARNEEAYSKGHLKNAIHLSPSQIVVAEPVAATIAPKNIVEEVLGNAGINKDTMLYIYDDKGGVYAGRVWWTLKVYGHENVKIINNGTTALEKLGLEMSIEKPEIEKTTYQAKDADESYLASFDKVKDFSDNADEFENVKLIDVRSIAEFEEGYIKNAILYPHTNNYYSDGTFKSSRDSFLFYSDLGLKKDDEIMLYCKSSYRASLVMAILDEAGFENVKVYDGAYLEWQEKESPTVEVEVAPITSQDAS